MLTTARPEDSAVRNSDLVHYLLQPEENPGTADVGFVAQPPHRPHESRIAADMPLHEMVETGSDQQAYGNDRIQLDGDRKARSFQRPPAQHDKHIHPQNSQCRRDMGTSEVDKHMMQVCLIGTKRRGPFQYARRHHPQRIEYGDR